jgi:hypothetical protein
MIADRVDLAPVRVRHLGELRRVDDHLPAVGDHRLDFVHTLRARPQIVVQRRQHRQHLIVRPFDIANMDARREIRRL